MAIAVAVLVASSSLLAANTTIVCVGNSVTAGTWLADRYNERYPAVLEKHLGDGYQVHVITPAPAGYRYRQAWLQVLP